MAKIVSLNGENSKSNTDLLWPLKRGVLYLTSVGKAVSTTATLPGVLFHDAAINFPLHAINFPSVTSDTKSILVNL